VKVYVYDALVGWVSGGERRERGVRRGGLECEV